MSKVYITADQITSSSTDRWCQETNISWARDDDILIVETSDNTFITKMKHIMERDPEHYKCYYYSGNVDKKTNKPSHYTFEVNKNLLSFRVSNAEKKQLTPEEKKALSERLKKK